MGKCVPSLWDRPEGVWHQYTVLEHTPGERDTERSEKEKAGGWVARKGERNEESRELCADGRVGIYK